MPAPVLDAARGVLDAAGAAAKARAALHLAALWDAGRLAPPEAGKGPGAPDRPARPERPVLVAPGKTAKRRQSSPEGRAALLHALAHIELNAIDLAFDILVRFGAGDDLPPAWRADFAADWISVGADEARHFLMLAARLEALGFAYGDFPAHDGLWRAATATADDLAARLAIAPLVLEARGLDVTPDMIGRLRAASDLPSAQCLDLIYREEHGHVRTGVAWFERIARKRGADPAELFQGLVRGRHPPGVKPPVNVGARRAAGLREGYYAPLLTAADALDEGARQG